MGPRVVILGRGNVASTLADGLREAGVDLLQMWHRGEALSPDADLYIIAVKDDAVAEVARLCPESALVVHTAGSVAMDVLPQQRRGVLYPMQSFTKGRHIDWSRVPFFVEASSETDCALLESFARRLSSSVWRLPGERRKTLHLAAVWVSNFPNHLWTVASDLLRREQLPFSVMLPLIEETAAKVHELSPREAQTGPARRNDIRVMQAHEAMLPEDLRLIYHLLSSSIHHDQLRSH